jgi:hypothetical protein
LYILWAFGNLEAAWYIFSRFGILCQEKSGKPWFGLRFILVGVKWKLRKMIFNGTYLQKAFEMA